MDTTDNVPGAPELNDKIIADISLPDSNENQPSDINTSDIKIMEVHHHPEMEKKGLKEYLLEGLMIFLAVSMGFLAENLREHITDNRRIQEYMQSMTADLLGDVEMYKSASIFNLNHCKMIDTIITSLQLKKNNTSEVYSLARQLTMGSSVISPDTKTFEQMKSSGSMRLIKKQALADSIGSYYQWVKKFDYWSELQRQRINDVINTNDKLFDANAFFSILKNMQNEKGSNLDVTQTNPTLITSDPQLINAVIMRHQYYYGILRLMNQRSALATEQAAKLIAFIKKEYQLKDE